MTQRKHMDGLLLVDKPQEWTSHDVCAFVRGRLRIKKVGHAGTLDPMATGLLVLLLGKATKQSGALTGHDKEYTGAMRLGVTTDSHDMSGKVLEKKSTDTVTLDQILKRAKEFCGEISQVPPMVSALKHQGVRLYKLARKGVSVPREPRPITVYRFEIDKKEKDLVSFSIHVSKGTYVRTIVHDLGQMLGCGATLANLRRTQSGPFDVKNAVTIPDLKKMDTQELSQYLLPLGVVYQYASLQKS